MPNYPFPNLPAPQPITPLQPYDYTGAFTSLAKQMADMEYKRQMIAIQQERNAIMRERAASGGKLTEKERKAAKKAEEIQAMQSVLAGDKEIQNILTGMEGHSNQKKLTSDIPRLRKRIGDLSQQYAHIGSSGDFFQSFLNQQIQNVAEETSLIKKDPWLSTALDVAGTSLANTWDAITAIAKTPQEREAIAKANIERRRQDIEQHPYLREQELRTQEGEGAFSRMTGTGGLSNVALFGAENLAIPVGIAGAALSAIPTGGLSLPVTGSILGLSGALTAGQTASGYLERAATDPRLTEEQRQAAFESTGGLAGAAATGFVSGAVPWQFGRVGSAVARAAAPRVSNPVISGMLQKAATPAPRGLSGAMRDLAIGGIEGAVVSGGSTIGENIAIGAGSGADIPVLENVGESMLMGGLLGGPMSAALGWKQRAPRTKVQRPTTPEGGEVSPILVNDPVADIRSSLLKAYKSGTLSDESLKKYINAPTTTPEIFGSLVYDRINNALPSNVRLPKELVDKIKLARNTAATESDIALANGIAKIQDINPSDSKNVESLAVTLSDLNTAIDNWETAQRSNGLGDEAIIEKLTSILRHGLNPKDISTTEALRNNPEKVYLEKRESPKGNTVQIDPNVFGKIGKAGEEKTSAKRQFLNDLLNEILKDPTDINKAINTVNSKYANLYRDQGKLLGDNTRKKAIEKIDKEFPNIDPVKNPELAAQVQQLKDIVGQFSAVREDMSAPEAISAFNKDIAGRIKNIKDIETARTTEQKALDKAKTTARSDIDNKFSTDVLKSNPELADRVQSLRDLIDNLNDTAAIKKETASGLADLEAHKAVLENRKATLDSIEGTKTNSYHGELHKAKMKIIESGLGKNDALKTLVADVEAAVGNLRNADLTDIISLRNMVNDLRSKMGSLNAHIKIASNDKSLFNDTNAAVSRSEKRVNKLPDDPRLKTALDEVKTANDTLRGTTVTDSDAKIQNYQDFNNKLEILNSLLDLAETKNKSITGVTKDFDNVNKRISTEAGKKKSDLSDDAKARLENLSKEIDSDIKRLGDIDPERSDQIANAIDDINKKIQLLDGTLGLEKRSSMYHVKPDIEKSNYIDRVLADEIKNPDGIFKDDNFASLPDADKEQLVRSVAEEWYDSQPKTLEAFTLGNKKLNIGKEPIYIDAIKKDGTFVATNESTVEKAVTEYLDELKGSKPKRSALPSNVELDINWKNKIGELDKTGDAKNTKAVMDKLKGKFQVDRNGKTNLCHK